MDSAILNWACRKLLPRLYIWTNFHARCQRCNRFHTLWQHVDPFFQIGEPLVALKHELSSSFQTIHVPSSCTRNGNLGKIIPSFSANESFATRSIALESLVERRGLYKSDDDSQVYHVRGVTLCLPAIILSRAQPAWTVWSIVKSKVKRNRFLEKETLMTRSSKATTA